MKWPKYIRLQRQRQVLYQRLKVPPSINQFTQTLDKQTGMERERVLFRYRERLFFSSLIYQLLRSSLAQLNSAILVSPATQLFKLLHKYRPETKIQKRERLRAIAQKKSEGGDVTPGKKPITIKYGINHITTLVEQKKAQLVIIAHDVDPIEVCVFSSILTSPIISPSPSPLSPLLFQIVVFLPALCRKMGVPYCIIKGKARYYPYPPIWLQTLFRGN